MGAFESQGGPPPLPGDFNDDGVYTCEDIDALVVHIADGLSDPAFDLNDDGAVNTLDVDQWLAIAGAENLPSGNAFLSSDANLDGRVNAADLNIVGQAWLSDVRGWCAGDFTADGRVDANDLNKIGLNWQMDVSGEAAAASAPGRTPRAPLAAHAAPAMVDVLANETSTDPTSSDSTPSVVQPTPVVVDSREGFGLANRSRIARYQTAYANVDSPSETEAISEADIVDRLLADWDG